MVRLLRTAADRTAGDDGWSHLSKVGEYIHNNSSFSVVNYGYQKLGDLIRASELFDINMRYDGTAMFIRDQRKQAPAAQPAESETA
ncbi:OST-HTH/LOTUS domain-containing protein [Ectopseudomonas mendocina]|uniref:OST-HTH/LOTUS domain-containing protein n=1 Tax=Ectopseudomonas mendocina TaxID=300 RepID=UPI001F184DCB|nr:OST-HTH/LOTUS domain-containing protein [Pseudomonas mendocina]